MIVLDTNIVSEVMRKTPDPRVLTWLNDWETNQMYLTAVTVAEISFGLRILPPGKRRNLLEQKFKQFKELAFSQRILSFDETAAQIYGDLMGYRREIGQPLSTADGQIAAITLSRDFALATRNTSDFQNCGLHLINPFI